MSKHTACFISVANPEPEGFPGKNGNCFSGSTLESNYLLGCGSDEGKFIVRSFIFQRPEENDQM